MPRVKTQFKPYPFLLVIFACSCLCAANAWGGGLSWGPVAEEPAAAACLAEESPLIVKGSLKSPMRLAEYGEDAFLVSDRSGSIYEVSRFDPANPVLLFQVDGSPLGVAFDGHDILVGNETSGKVERYSLRRNHVRKGRSIPKSKTERIQPLDIAVDKARGMTFVVDGLGGDIKVYDRRGKTTLIIGGLGQLVQPKALTLKPGAEEVIVTDYGNPRIGVSASLKVFNYSGDHLQTINGPFSRPQGVWSEGQSLYLVDSILGQVLEFDRDTGSMLSTQGCFGSAEGHLMLPMDLLYDSQLREFFVADNRNGRVTVLPLPGQ